MVPIRTTAPPRPRPRQDPERPPGVTCAGCGAPLPRSRMRNCPECYAELPGQDPEARARRGQAIAATRAELEAWRAERPGAPGPGCPLDPAQANRFRDLVLPRLAGVRLREIMAVLGVAKSSASEIRSGRHLPALWHWPALAELAGVEA